MKLKKLISVMLIGACVCSMAACGSKKEEKKIESADDLKDAKIGVQTGTTGDIYCSDDFGDDHVERFNKGADAVQALVKGKIDAVVIDNEPAKAFVDANDGLKILETPYVEEDYAMCFKKGNTELEDKFNAAIKELKEDGTFDKIVGYYIDGTEEKGYESPADVDHSNGKLVMATNAAFEPYEYYEDNKIVGVDVDFAQAIADKLGMELTVNDMEFDRLGAFTYSAEEGTPAAEMPDQVPQEQKEEWQADVMELQEEVIFDKNEAMKGTVLYAFIEGQVADENNTYVGRTYRDAPNVDGYIFINTDEELLTGDIVKVEVTGAYEYDLIATIVK